MGKLFSIDGPLYRIGTLIIDLVYMNFLWLLFTIIGLGITGGASTSAIFYVMQRRADNKGSCNFAEFYYGFKKSFLSSTIIWGILILVITIVQVNLHYIPFFQSMTGNSYVTLFIMGAQLLFLIEVIILSIYVFNILAKHNGQILKILKIAFVLAHKHLFTTITCIALTAVVTMGFLHVPILFCVGASGYALLTTLIIKEKINFSS